MPSLPARMDLPRVSTAVLALALLLQAAALVVQWRSDTVQPVAPGLVPERREALVDVNGLQAANLFGTRSRPAEEAVAGSASLRLSGVIASQWPEQGIAILAEGSGVARAVVTGEQVPGGGRLVGVYPDRVVLERDGVLEYVLLPTRIDPDVAAVPAAVAVAASGQVSTGGTVAGLFNAVAGQKGFDVYPSDDLEAFDALGLRSGDLIIRINGAPLADRAASQAALRSLVDSPEAVVTVVRGGVETSLPLRLAQVRLEADLRRRELAVAQKLIDQEIPTGYRPTTRPANGEVEE